MGELNKNIMKTLSERKKFNRKHINDNLSSSEDNNAKLIKNEAKSLCGNYVDFFGNHYGYLLGATCGYYDYYWVYIDKDLKICFSSCVCNPSKLDNIPNINFSVLDYLINNDVESIIERVKERLKTVDDVFFTPLYINGKEYEIGDIV